MAETIKYDVQQLVIAQRSECSGWSLDQHVMSVGGWGLSERVGDDSQSESIQFNSL